MSASGRALAVQGDVTLHVTFGVAVVQVRRSALQSLGAPVALLLERVGAPADGSYEVADADGVALSEDTLSSALEAASNGTALFVRPCSQLTCSDTLWHWRARGGAFTPPRALPTL